MDTDGQPLILNCYKLPVKRKGNKKLKSKN